MYTGIGAVLSAVGTVGWSGFGLLCLYVLGLFVILGAAWYVLLPGSSPPGLPVFIWARMVRDAASDVLPFSQIGGIVLGARAAILHGVSNPLVYASTIVDVTTEMLAQIAYIALGVLILDLRAPPTSFSHSLTRGLLIGLVFAVAAAGVFLLFNPLAGAVALTLVVGAMFIFQGAAELMFAMEMRPASGWVGMLLSGIASIALAIIIAYGWPAISLVVLGLLLGINFLTTGLGYIFVSRAFKA